MATAAATLPSSSSSSFPNGRRRPTSTPFSTSILQKERSSFHGRGLSIAESKTGILSRAEGSGGEGVEEQLPWMGADVDVKRLPKRPALPRLGRKLTEAQKPENYACPQCSAPKKRFAQYDVNTGKPIGGGPSPVGVILGLVAGIAGVRALLVYGLP